jgi:hypothetical protein
MIAGGLRQYSEFEGRFNLIFFLLRQMPLLKNARASIIALQLEGEDAMNGKILGFLVVGLTVGSLISKMAPAQDAIATIDPNNYANGQVITAPGVTMQTETFASAGTVDGVALYSPVFSPVYSYTASCTNGAFPCPAVGTNLFAPSPDGASPSGGVNVPNGGFWGGASGECVQDCIFNSSYANNVWLKVDFNTPTDLVNILAFSTGGDPTVITAFDAVGNAVGTALDDPFGTNPGWGYASLTTGTSDISSVLIGGANSTYQGINEINFASVRAPEIDTTSAASGLTLLFGGLLILRGRRTASAARRST